MKKRYLFYERTKRSLTQEQVALAVGLTKKGYNHIEIGRREPSWPVAKRLGDFFNQDPRVLLAETKDSDSVNC